MDLHPIPNRLPPAGFCIYCGVREPEKILTKEHIIPFSLGGTLELPKASCLSCADVTKKIEQYTGRNVFQDVRIEHKFPTRNPKERPVELPLRESFSPTPEAAPIRLVPTKDYPGAVFLVNPEPAGILIGRPLEVGPKVIPFVKTLGGRSRVLRLKKRNIPALLYRELRPEIIMRLIAKISLGFAIASYGHESFNSSLIRNIILSPNIYPYHIIGGTTAEMVEFPPNSSPSALHRVVGFPQFIGDDLYLLYQVQIFAYLGAPIFTIVMGKLTQAGIDKLIPKENV